MRHWRFTGVNHLLMNIQSQALGFKSRWWATEQQWFKLGGRLTKRPEGALVASWGQAVRPHGNYYYNIDQIQGGKGLNRHRFTFKHKPLEPAYDALVELIEASGAKIRFGADKARYLYPPHDYIECPDHSRFERISEFFTVILHEIGHCVMHLKGIDRGYAANELIVQLAAFYLAADMGVPVEEDLDNHVAYLDLWLKEMKANPSYILHASRDARGISNYLQKKWHESKRRVA